MTQTSLLCRFFAGVWAALSNAWTHSALGGWFGRRREDFRAAAQESNLCRVAVREGALRRSWEGSLFQKLVCGLLALPATVFQAIYRLAKNWWDGSLLCRALTGLGKRAWLLVGLLVLVMLVAPHEMWDNLYAFLGAAAVFGLFAIGCADKKLSLETTRLGPHFALYFLFITLGLVASLRPELSLRFYLFHLTCLFVTVVAVSAIRTYDQLRAVLLCAAVGVTVAALYGCYQGYVGVEVVASQQDLALNEGMPGRIYSFFDNPNNFAEVLVMTLPLVGALTLNAKGWRGRVLGVFSLAAGLGAIGMTYSRSSWLGLALAAVIFLTLLDWRCLPGLLIVGVCAVPFLPESIMNRILTIGNMKDSSARYRVAIYEDTALLLKDHGLTGVGLGSDVVKKVFRNYPTLYDGNYPIHTHNNYLQMWSEMGIFGLLAFLAAAAGQLKEGLQAFRKADKRLRRVLAASMGSMAGILAIGLVEYTWFYPRNMFLFWFLFAILAASVKLTKSEN